MVESHPLAEMTIDAVFVSGKDTTIMNATVTMTTNTTNHIDLGASNSEPTILEMSMGPVADHHGLLNTGRHIPKTHEE